MDVYTTDEERVEALRKWWKENGLQLIAGVAIGLAGVFGWNAWQQHSNTRAEWASVRYTAMVQAMEAGDREGAIRQGEQLISDQGDSAYGVLAALAIARMKLEQEDVTGAAAHLEWALGKVSRPELERLVRLRLARVRLAQERHDDALTLLDQAPAGAYEGLYQDLRGDIHFARGERDAARNAWNAALAVMEPGDPLRSNVEMKRDDIAPPGDAS